MSGYNVLIVEDEALVAKDIAYYLEDAQFKVIGIAHDSETALDYLYSRQPDLVVLDINILGTRDGIEVAEIIHETYKIPFIFLTAFSDLATLERAKKVHPCAYIVKPFDEQNLISSITIGLYNFNQRKTDNALSLESLNKMTPHEFTPREFEIVEDLLHGLSNIQIAEKQYVSRNTVKYHLKNIYLKFDVSSRSQLISKIIQHSED